MKTIKIILLILLFIINFGFSYNKTSKYSPYIDKIVKITTINNNIYIGKLIYIHTIDLCQRYDIAMGTCIDYIYFHTLILFSNNYFIPIPEDIIVSIQD